jgi:hypothetical protein
MMKKIGGWGNFLAFIILLMALIFGILKKQSRNRNSSYVFGISKGIKKGVRGNLRLYYRFSVNGVHYTGRVPESFCKDCKTCCNPGDTVIVRYENNNPENNELVIAIP